MKEEILEAITEPDLMHGMEFNGYMYYPRVLSLDKLAEYLTAKLINTQPLPPN